MILYVLAAGLILLGFAGTFLPALPGLPLMFIGMLVAAWADQFVQVGGWTIAVLALLNCRVGIFARLVLQRVEHAEVLSIGAYCKV